MVRKWWTNGGMNDEIQMDIWTVIDQGGGN